MLEPDFTDVYRVMASGSERLATDGERALSTRNLTIDVTESHVLGQLPLQIAELLEDPQVRDQDRL